MADIQTLAADTRDRAGKGTARAARRAGRIPAVIYGNNEPALMITVERRLLEQELQDPSFFVRLVDIEVAGARHRVLPRDAQLHPVTDRPLHIDFLRFSADRKITVDVPVVFLNEEAAPGIKTGGVLNIVRHEIEVSCTADAIPEHFEIDLTGLDIGDSIHASTLALPEGVSLTITDRDFTIATVAAPTVMPTEEEEAAAAEGVEGAAPATEEGEAESGEESKEGSGD
jgi:large subunit ribosomal protein L25